MSFGSTGLDAISGGGDGGDGGGGGGGNGGDDDAACTPCSSPSANAHWFRSASLMCCRLIAMTVRKRVTTRSSLQVPRCSNSRLRPRMRRRRDVLVTDMHSRIKARTISVWTGLASNVTRKQGGAPSSGRKELIEVGDRSTPSSLVRVSSSPKMQTCVRARGGKGPAWFQTRIQRGRERESAYITLLFPCRLALLITSRISASTLPTSCCCCCCCCCC